MRPAKEPAHGEYVVGVRTEPRAAEPIPQSFAESHDRWAALGFVVIPGSPTSKTPGCCFWPFTKDGSNPRQHPDNRVANGRRVPTPGARAEWCSRFNGAAKPLLLLDSSTGDLADLAVIDLDVADPALEAWVLATFGDTPLRVTTGRGLHFYYAVPSGERIAQKNGALGPPSAFVRGGKMDLWRSKIDFKGSRSYVVAPGAVHKSGRIYTPSATITRDLLASLPDIDPEVLASEFWKGRPEPPGSRSAQAKPRKEKAEQRSAVPPTRAGSGPAEPRVVAAEGRHNRKAQQRSSVPPTRALTVADLSLTVIESGAPYAGLRITDLPEDARTKCPFHGGESLDSLHVLAAGRLLYCFSESMTYLHEAGHGGLRALADGGAEDRTSHRSIPLEVVASAAPPPSPALHAPAPAITPALLPAPRAAAGVAPLSLIELPPRQFLPPIDPAPGRSFGLLSPKGTGKTHLLRAVCDDLRASNPSARILAPCHLVTLSRALADRLALPNYQDEAGAIRGSSAYVINSQQRIALYDARSGSVQGDAPDLVILDEVESTLQALSSPTMTALQQQAVFAAFDLMIRMAKRVIVADADLSPYSIDFINSRRPHDPLVVVRMDSVLRWRYEIGDGFHQTHLDIAREWGEGKRVAVAVTSLKAAEALALSLQESRPSARVLCLSKRTAPDYDFAGLNATIKGDGTPEHPPVDALIYTPVLSTGVSIDAYAHFDRIFGLFYGRTLTAEGCFQMLHRVRYPRSRTIRIGVESTAQPLPTDPRRIRALVLSQAAATKQGAREHGFAVPIQVAPLCVSAEGAIVQSPEAERFLDHYCNTVAHQRTHGGNDLQAAIVAYLWEQNLETAPLFVEQPEKGSPLLADLKEEIKHSKIRANAIRWDAVFAAPEITIEEARKIGRPKSSQEALAKERAIIKDFYGYIDLGIVHYDSDGTKRAPVRALARVEHVQEDGGVEDLLARDVADLCAGVAAPRLRHDWLLAVLRVKLLATFGLTLAGGEEVDPTTAKAAGAILFANRQRLIALGLYIRADVRSAPIKTLSSILRPLGLKLTTRRKQAGRVTERYYRLHPGPLMVLRKAGVAERQRLRAGTALEAAA